MLTAKEFEERYTPKTIGDIVFPNETSKELIEQLVKGQRPFPIAEGKCGILLYGISGTGKSALAKISNHAVLMPYQASQHYYVLDEVDNLNAQAMAVLKSVMNTAGNAFILTTNHFEHIEQGVRSRCHCIPFNATPAPAWLPLAHRMIADAGISGITDQQLLSVIATGKGSARDITDALMSVVLDAMRVKQ
jgi:DNA polymerase III delta prime subunit